MKLRGQQPYALSCWTWIPHRGSAQHFTYPQLCAFPPLRNILTSTKERRFMVAGLIQPPLQRSKDLQLLSVLALKRISRPKPKPQFTSSNRPSPQQSLLVQLLSARCHCLLLLSNLLSQFLYKPGVCSSRLTL